MTIRLPKSLEGFPVWQILVVSLFRFAEPIAFTSMFPYVYFMVRDFGIAEDETQISAYTGYLSAAFAFFQFLLCVKWSRLSDRIGRKPILICGLLGTGTSMLIFGFSSNFYVALLARSCMGALNGNIAVLRTVIGELATERRHQALAFSTLPLFWNLGSVIGPLIGGSKYFTRPRGSTDHKATANDSSYEIFMDTYPYALSNIVVAFFLVLGVILGALFFEETHPRLKKRRDFALDVGDWLRKKLGYDVPVRPWQRRRKGSYSVLASLGEEEEQRFISGSHDGFDHGGSDDDDDDDVDDANVEVSGFNSKTFTGPVISAMTANSLLSFQNLVFQEFLPVFLAGEFMKDKLEFPIKITGGFGYSSDEIGTLLSTAGFLGVFSVMFILPIMNAHLRTIDGFRISTTIAPFAYFMLPFLIFTLHGYNAAYPAWVTKVLLYVLTAVATLSTTTAFPQLLILIHRASHPQHTALINGTTMSLISFARFVAPLTWGWLISFFDSYSLGGLSWWLLSFMAVGSCCQAFMMKEHNEDLKTEIEPEEIEIDTL